jgi:hypothetical protein
MSAVKVHVGDAATAEGRVLHVHASASHVLISDGDTMSRDSVFHTVAARQLAVALVRAADVVEGTLDPDEAADQMHEHDTGTRTSPVATD